MSIAVALKHMLAAGMPFEAIVDAVAEMEAALVVAPAPKSKAALRTAKWRAGKTITDRHETSPRDDSDVCDAAETVAQKEVPEPLRKTTPIPPLKGGTFPKLQPQSFDLWWDEYPLKVGKGAARKAYGSALRKTTAENLLASLIAHRFDPDPKFRPHPATWLNGERWADSDAEPPRPPAEPTDPWPKRLKNWRINGYWHSDWGAKPGKPGCKAPTEALMSAGYLPPPNDTPALDQAA